MLKGSKSLKIGEKRRTNKWSDFDKLKRSLNDQVELMQKGLF